MSAVIDPAGWGLQGPVRWTRIGLMDHATSETKPLLGFQPSSDGGLMLSANYLPSSSWEYGILEAPSGRYAGSRPSTIRERRTSEMAPKLHYHRSGWTSINLAGRAERVSVKCLPIQFMRGVQCFSAMFENPAAAPSRRMRPGDLASVSHSGWPTTWAVLGFLHGRDQVPNMEKIVPGPAGMVMNHRAVLVVDLRHYGLESVLELQFVSSYEPLPSSAPAAGLYGFDYHVTVDGFAQVVGAWTRGGPTIVPLLRPDQSGFATIAYPRASSRIESIRRADGGSIEMATPFVWT